MTDLKLKVGHTYRAKKPGSAGSLFHSLVNDRTIIWLGAFELQYDGPSVKNGSRYPKVLISKFREWADRDVTSELPEGDYAPWPIPANEVAGKVVLPTEQMLQYWAFQKSIGNDMLTIYAVVHLSGSIQPMGYTQGWSVRLSETRKMKNMVGGHTLIAIHQPPTP